MTREGRLFKCQTPPECQLFSSSRDILTLFKDEFLVNKSQKRTRLNRGKSQSGYTISHFHTH